MRKIFSQFTARKFFAENSFLLALGGLYLIIVVPLAYFLNVWMDEASTLYTTQNGILAAFQNAATIEKQAPLYFWMLSVWRDINHSVFFARSFAIVISLAAIKNFFDLAQLIFDQKEAKFVTAFFALHPFFIWASLEIRVYSTIVLLSVLLLKFFYEGYFQSREEANISQKKVQIFYVLTAVIALYTNYYLGFILAGNFFALLAVRRFRAAQTYFLQMMIGGVCALPLLWIIKQQFAANTAGFHEQTSFVEGVRIIWGHTLTFIFPTELATTGEASTVSTIRIWLARLTVLLTIIFALKDKFQSVDKKMIALGTITAIICAFLLAAYFFVGSEYIALRHAAPLFVPLILFAAMLFVKFIPQKIWLIFAVIIVFLFSYSFYDRYAPLAKRGDWIRVAEFIETNETTNQPIIIFRNFDALSLPYYYHGANKILPDKNFFAWTNEDELTSENALRRETEFTISQIPPNAPEIWLATEEICQNKDTAAACQPLENYVEANYDVLRTQDFYKERVRLLRKK